MDPDSPVIFTLKYAVSNSASPGNYSLKLRITYYDSRNIQQNATISVPLNVTNSSTAAQTSPNSGGFWGWLKSLLGFQ